MAADSGDKDDFVSQFMKFGKDLNLPKPDLEALVERHRKNLQALDTAARTAGSGASAVLTRQREMVQDALREMSSMAENMQAGGTDPSAFMATQADFAKRSFETAIKNASELAGMAQKSGTEAFKVLQSNMQESLEELREAMLKGKK